MARRKKSKRARSISNYEDAINWVSAIVLIASGTVLFLGAVGASGPIGSAAFIASYGAIGFGAFILPIAIIMLGVYAGFKKPVITPVVAGGSTLLLAAVLSFAGLFSSTEWGGYFGTFIGGSLETFFGFWGALILLLALILIALAAFIDVEILFAGLFSFFTFIYRSLLSKIKYSNKKEEDSEEDDIEEESESESESEEDDIEEESESESEEDDIEEESVEHEPIINRFDQNSLIHADGSVANGITNFDETYNPPDMRMLESDKGKPGVGDIKANTNIIKRTFQNFGISVEMDEVSVGPTVTRYAFKPAEGVRLSKIISLQNNLELALAAHPVRIEAPIPGKSLVGIEVPNTLKATVGLYGLLMTRKWQESKNSLLVALGRNIAGSPHYMNLAKAPHVLVAGATGSGKSVAIHAIITSLLYRNGPNQLRFIMVDPKRVELTLYNGIPHLLTPVITDAKKTIVALKWAAKEMGRRYNILESEHVRDIESYHQTILEPARKRNEEEKKKGISEDERLDMPEAMPYIVIVIDELATIMQSYPRELEALVVQLAQMSRAVGIHLILSTQRPSVNVITGLIKANIPTRMALQVASQIDSRTILDSSGAEMLLGSGDMLYLSADMQKPVRIQMAFISETEVKKTVQYIKKHNSGDLISLELSENGKSTEPNDAILLAGDDDEADDDLYGEARMAVEEAGRASTSYLQRKLRIGYSRAARLMDILEERGIVGEADGSRPRQILSQIETQTDTDNTISDEENEEGN